MAENTKIEWCDHTFNPWIGCTKVSQTCTGGGGCDDCYAEVSTPVRVLRAKGIETWGPGAPRHRTSVANWRHPLTWNAQPFYECPHCGLRGDARTMGDEPKACKHLNARPARRRVFCASLADVFDNEVPREWRLDLFNLIEQTPKLEWLLLTKRIGNAADMLADVGHSFPGATLPHVRIGATMVNQKEWDRDIRKLLAVNTMNFVSLEPLLGPIDMGVHGHRVGAGAIRGLIDWVITGGESGPKARPSHPEWFRSLRDQCAAAGVPFMFKQWGEWADARWSGPGGDGPVHVWGDGAISARVGRDRAGRLLDGDLHNAFPEVACPR